jgi:hypothetical protein
MELKDPRELNIDDLRASTVPQLQQTGREYFGRELSGNKAQIFAQLSDLIIKAQDDQAKGEVVTQDPDLSNVQQDVTTGPQDSIISEAEAEEAISAAQIEDRPPQIHPDDAAAKAEEERKPAELSEAVVLEALQEAQTPINIPKTQFLLNKSTGMVFRNSRDIAVKSHIVAYHGRPVLVDGKIIMDRTYAKILWKRKGLVPRIEELPDNFFSDNPKPIPMNGARG